MDQENVRIRLRIKDLEVEYEGDTSFVRADLPGFIDRILEIHETREPVLPSAPLSNPAANDSAGQANRIFDLSTAAIATNLGGEKGPDLAMAAAAHLALVDGKDMFSRKEILDEMKSATSHYTKNMSGNLTPILDGLCKKKRLIQRSKGEYALPLNERKIMEESLAQFG